LLLPSNFICALVWYEHGYAATALPAEMLSNFYNAANKVSDRSRQKEPMRLKAIQDRQAKRKKQQGIHMLEAKA